MQLWNPNLKRLSPTVLAAILLIGMTSLVAAQPAPATDRNLVKSIDETLTQAYKPNEPGAAVIVVKDGKVVLRKGYGMANLELAVPVEQTWSFDWVQLQNSLRLPKSKVTRPCRRKHRRLLRFSSNY